MFLGCNNGGIHIVIEIVGDLILLGGFFVASLIIVVLLTKFSSFLKNKLQLGEDYIPYIISSELVKQQIEHANVEIAQINKKSYKIPKTNMRKMRMKVEGINQLIKEYNNNVLLPKKEAEEILLEEINKIEFEISKEQPTVFFGSIKTPLKKEKSRS